MEYYVDQFWLFLSGMVSGGWGWFKALNLEEWLLVLTLTAVCGFLCMLGYGSRSKY